MFGRLGAAAVPLAMVVFVSTAARAQGTFEVDTNRWGGDIAHFQIGANPQDCQRACVQENRCVAWTYAQAAQRCYLKGSAQTPTPLKGAISGLVRGGGKPAPVQPTTVKSVVVPAGLNPSCSNVYMRHTTRRGAKAFALDANGWCLSIYERKSVQKAVDDALASCASKRRVGCRILESTP